MNRASCPYCGQKWTGEFHTGRKDTPDLTNLAAVAICSCCQKLTKVHFLLGMFTLSALTAQEAEAFERSPRVRDLRQKLRTAQAGNS